MTTDTQAEQVLATALRERAEEAGTPHLSTDQLSTSQPRESPAHRVAWVAVAACLIVVVTAAAVALRDTNSGSSTATSIDLESTTTSEPPANAADQFTLAEAERLTDEALSLLASGNFLPSVPQPWARGSESGTNSYDNGTGSLAINLGASTANLGLGMNYGTLEQPRDPASILSSEPQPYQGEVPDGWDLAQFQSVTPDGQRVLQTQVAMVSTTAPTRFVVIWTYGAVPPEDLASFAAALANAHPLTLSSPANDDPATISTVPLIDRLYVPTVPKGQIIDWIAYTKQYTGLSIGEPCPSSDAQPTRTPELVMGFAAVKNSAGECVIGGWAPISDSDTPYGWLPIGTYDDAGNYTAPDGAPGS